MENEVNNKFFTKTFFWMFLGLIGTAIIAAYTYYSGLWLKIAFSNALPVLAILELIAVLVFSFLFKRLSPMLAGIIYFLYAFLNGVNLSSIFALYELNSIVLAFVSTAAMFGVLALIGYKTNKDLSNWSTMLSVLLIVGIIASIFNLFMQNTMLDLGLTWGILILFFFITIYDMNRLKNLAQDLEIETDKLHIYAALELYLDFINIFLRLLRLIGKYKD